MISDSGKLYISTKNGCIEKFVGEVTCISAVDEFFLIGLWDGSIVQITDGISKTIYHRLVPRSLCLNPAGDSCCIGFDDGSVVLLSRTGSEWNVVVHDGQCCVTVPSISFSNNGFIISGDKPCVISTTGEKIDIVDTITGTVTPMHHMCMMSDGVVFYMDGQRRLRCGYTDSDRMRDFHVQRSTEYDWVDYFPICLASSNDRLIVSFSSEGGVDHLALFDEGSLKQLAANRELFIPTEYVTCLDGHRGVLFAGTCLDGGREGRLLALSVTADNAVELLGETRILTSDGISVAGLVSCVKIIDNQRLVVAAGRTVALMRWDANEFLHIASIECGYFITAMDAVVAGNTDNIRILIGDMSKSITVLEYNSSNPQTSDGLNVIGRDWESAQVSHVSFLGIDRYIFTDMIGNIFSCEIFEPQTRRIKRVEGVYIGAQVTALKRVPPTRIDEGSSVMGNREFVWIGTDRGSLYKMWLDNSDDMDTMLTDTSIAPILTGSSRRHIPLIRLR
jgi:hypothetical protein